MILLDIVGFQPEPRKLRQSRLEARRKDQNDLCTKAYIRPPVVHSAHNGTPTSWRAFRRWVEDGIQPFCSSRRERGRGALADRLSGYRADIVIEHVRGASHLALPIAVQSPLCTHPAVVYHTGSTSCRTSKEAMTSWALSGSERDRGIRRRRRGGQVHRWGSYRGGSSRS
jgi:hypothetical protein